MNKLIILFGLFLIFSSKNIAQDIYTGNDIYVFHKSCNKVIEGRAGEQDHANLSYFTGWLTGITDVLSFWNILNPPEGLSAQQVANIMVSYMNKHPEARQQRAVHLLQWALEDAIPGCMNLKVLKVLLDNTPTEDKYK